MSNDLSSIKFSTFSRDELPPPFDGFRYGIQKLHEDYMEEDDDQSIVIDEESSFSPYKSPAKRSQNVTETSFNDAQPTSSSSFAFVSVNDKEAEYLIRNANLAYMAAENASSCRLHAEKNGTTCEMLQDTVNELRSYVSNLQNRLMEVKNDKDDNQKQKIDFEKNKPYLQEIGFLEIQKYKEEYEKSQDALRNVLNAYSSLKEKYNEAIKLANTFAKKHDDLLHFLDTLQSPTSNIITQENGHEILDELS